ncbi:MAG TPA: toll/interleukin-1 receptor domain-containing protein [Flavisolibacter sp.]|nr:toll/interleukin-1 receptor domain-containing protein [Flavisolibacter sp.]
MAAEKKYGVFVSYSREDIAFVNPIVELVGAVRKDLVFQDTRSLQKGKPWMPQLLAALNEADVVLVFWCQHSAESEYVKLEYETAVRNNKVVIPLQLDDSELIKPLADYEGIDFRAMHLHDRPQPNTVPQVPAVAEGQQFPPLPPQAPAPLPPPVYSDAPKPKAAANPKIFLVILIVVAAIVFVYVKWFNHHPRASNNTTSSGRTSEPGAGFPWMFIPIASVVIALFFAVWRWLSARRKKNLRRRQEPGEDKAGEQRRQGGVLSQIDKWIAEANITPDRKRIILEECATDVLKKLDEKIPPQS